MAYQEFDSWKDFQDLIGKKNNKAFPYNFVIDFLVVSVEFQFSSETRQSFEIIANSACYLIFHKILRRSKISHDNRWKNGKIQKEIQFFCFLNLNKVFSLFMLYIHNWSFTTLQSGLLTKFLIPLRCVVCVNSYT